MLSRGEEAYQSEERVANEGGDEAETTLRERWLTIKKGSGSGSVTYCHLYPQRMAEKDEGNGEGRRTIRLDGMKVFRRQPQNSFFQ